MSGPGVFARLVGQEPVAAELARAASRPRSMTHAWLFTGPPGSGRSVAARAFAAALQCEQQDRRGCGECPRCRQVLGGSHPDLTLVATETTFLQVREARELALTSQARPTVGPWRVILVEDADRLTEKAADALLKALEEPPPRTVWLLCAPSWEDLIITIRSRCRHVQLRTPPVAAVVRLLEAGGVDAPLAHYAARAAQSHIGIARRLATDETERVRRRELTAVPLRLTGLGEALSAAAEVEEATKESSGTQSEEEVTRKRRELLVQLGADPDARTQPPSVRAHLRQLEEDGKRRARRRQHDSLDAALGTLASVYRDALVLSTGAEVEPVNATELEQVRQLAGALSPEWLLQALDTIGLARQRLEANGTPLLVLEAMMIGLVLPDAPSGRQLRRRERTAG